MKRVAIPLVGIEAAISHKYGLHMNETMSRSLDTAASHLADQLEISLTELARRVPLRDDLLARLVAQVTITDSHFGRHPEQLELFSEWLRERSDLPGRSFEIWSAGCAQGEEPYSIAITVLERLPQLARRVHILASDVSQAAIDSAKTMKYSNWALRRLEPNSRKKYLRQTGNESRLHPDVAKLVHFECESIQWRVRLSAPKRFDAIFFRNVGIYLKEEVLFEIHRAFARLMKDDALLLQAPSDPLPDRELFVRFAEHTPAFKLRMVAKPAAVQSQPKALGLKSAAVELPMSDAQALDHFRQATFASPGDSLARYHYAHLLYQNGSAKRALVQLNILMAELSSLQAELFLSDGETRVAELLRAVRQFRELLL